MTKLLPQTSRPTRLTIQRGAKSVNAVAPKLPHERDESPEVPAKPDPRAVQGHIDVTKGLADTDGREEAGRAFDNPPPRRLRRGK